MLSALLQVNKYNIIYINIYQSNLNPFCLSAILASFISCKKKMTKIKSLYLKISNKTNGIVTACKSMAAEWQSLKVATLYRIIANENTYRISSKNRLENDTAVI